MTVTFNLEASEVFNDVKMNTSYMAERTDDFDMVVFDDEYPAMFHNLFMEARSHMAYRLSSYLKEPLSQAGQDYFVDRMDHTGERDFLIVLELPDDWKRVLRRYVYSEMRAYASAYIIYGWLMGMTHPVPEHVVSHYRRQYEEHLDSIEQALEKRGSKPRIRPCLPW